MDAYYACTTTQIAQGGNQVTFGPFLPDGTKQLLFMTASGHTTEGSGVRTVGYKLNYCTAQVVNGAWAPKTTWTEIGTRLNTQEPDLNLPQTEQDALSLMTGETFQESATINCAPRVFAICPDAPPANPPVGSPPVPAGGMPYYLQVVPVEPNTKLDGTVDEVFISIIELEANIR